MISITAEYALRAVVFLARQPDRAHTTHSVAAGTHVPAGYLSKVLQALTRAELIASVRGIYGGYQLVRPPASLSALEVINAVDPIRRIRKCPLGLSTHGERLCPLHRKLDYSIALAEEAFATTSIAELAAESSESEFCPFPVAAPPAAPAPQATPRSESPRSNGPASNPRARRPKRKKPR